MYAIVEIAGQQFKVKKNQKIFVHRLEGAEGSKVEFNKVLLVENDGKIDVGAPTVDGYRVAAKIVEHLKGDKVLIFKKKRRKGYQKLNGHRQYMTQLLIQGVLGKGETLVESAEESPVKKAKKATKVVADASSEKPKKTVTKKKTIEK